MATYTDWVVENPNTIMWGVTVAYAIQAVIYALVHKNPQAMMLAGYAFANVGLIWSIK